MDPYRLYYRRHLPHLQPCEAILFVTFRLKGSLPSTVVKSLLEEREQKKRSLEYSAEEPHVQRDYLDERRPFVRWDTLLDQAGHGPSWLAQPAVAKIVQEALHYRDGREYDLFAFCIMPNHVHTVFQPLSKSGSRSSTGRPGKSEWHSNTGMPGKSDWQSDLPDPQGDSDLALSKIMQSLKRHTARKANLFLGREGPFWQDESYDHVVRNESEFERILRYVLENPVKAGLVSDWVDWPWTYCKSD